MNFMRLSYLYAAVFFFGIITSCSKETTENLDTSAGSEYQIKSEIGENLYEAVKSQGFKFNTGNTPPIIEGIYKADKLQIQMSNISNDPGLNKFIDPVTFYFNGQNNESLTTDFSKHDGHMSYTDIDEAKIVGNGQNFTVYYIVKIKSNGYINEYLEAYSGVYSEEGLKDFQFAFFMKEVDQNAPEDIFFKNNTGRIFVETDQLAENDFVSF